jgi:hypothetical protein
VHVLTLVLGPASISFGAPCTFERSQSGHDIKVLVVIDTEAFNA